jgi:hypothetical protein
MGAVGGPSLQTMGPVQCSFRSVPKNRSFPQAPAGSAAAQGGGSNQIVRVSCVASQPGVPVTVILRASE